ncbi:tetratricopeptide repeat-containing sensor histidine kinase [Flavobacterium endoglycinae]|uniref:tetratricopeptide repeat-containing sensor histidine kinase n=1 Tax=Flavobacterium endoglycinae TaxID=2816357 RepID=UPI001EEF8C44|nr:tetratricopeptide repeat-containing sensor histidine kinase [Flavobacterium endoglycinae]
MNISNQIPFLILFFLFLSCKKSDSASSENDSIIFFDKNYADNLKGDKKEKYLDSTVLVLKAQRNNLQIRNTYLKVASEYYYINNPKKSLNVSLKALKLSKMAHDSVRMAKASYFVGDCYENTKKDSAYFYYLQAEKIYFKLHDDDNVARMLFNKGYVLFYDGNYIECNVEISKALQYLKGSKDYELIYTCNTLMGNCLEKLLQYEEALKYHNMALEVLDKMKGNEKDQINNYNITSIINVCNLYDLQGEYSKSIEKLKPLLTDELKEGWPRLYANVLSNLAYSKMKSKDYKYVGPMLFESLRIVDSIGLEPDIIYKKIHIGEYYLTQNDTVNSIKVLNEANHLAIKIKSSNEILTTLRLLYKVDKKNSLFYTSEYIKVSDSINTIQRNAHDKYSRIEYETSRIEDENKVLTKTNFYILITSFVLILGLLIIIVLRYFKYKNQELKFFKKEQQANEEIYQLLTDQHEKIINAKENEKTKIAKELHDGIMNKIYSVRMNLGFFNANNDVEIIEKRKGYIYELQNIENEIRTISHGLSNSSLLEQSDFNILLLTLIENQKEISQTKFTYLDDDNIDWRNTQIIYKINLYRIIQEAVLNVNKYANAKKCEVKIYRKKHNILKLTIVDDGVGFDVKSRKGGIGINNMRDRAISLNGKFNITSKPNEGTKIEVTLNLSSLNEVN